MIDKYTTTCQGKNLSRIFPSVVERRTKVVEFPQLSKCKGRIDESIPNNKGGGLLSVYRLFCAIYRKTVIPQASIISLGLSGTYEVANILLLLYRDADETPSYLHKYLSDLGVTKTPLFWF